MKKVLFVVSTLLLITTYASAEWVTPSKKACTKNGGKLARGGFCNAHWYAAKQICSAVDSRLPSLHELKREVTSCGGKIDDYNNNDKNTAYKSCYKKNGFRASGFYWSSVVDEDRMMWAFMVNFRRGRTTDGQKRVPKHVRCVRGRQ